MTAYREEAEMPKKPEIKKQSFYSFTFEHVLEGLKLPVKMMKHIAIFFRFLLWIAAIVTFIFTPTILIGLFSHYVLLEWLDLLIISNLVGWIGGVFTFLYMCFACYNVANLPSRYGSGDHNNIDNWLFGNPLEYHENGKLKW